MLTVPDKPVIVVANPGARSIAFTRKMFAAWNAPHRNTNTTHKVGLAPWYTSTELMEGFRSLGNFWNLRWSKVSDGTKLAKINIRIPGKHKPMMCAILRLLVVEVSFRTVMKSTRNAKGGLAKNLHTNTRPQRVAVVLTLNPSCRWK